jgi:hypothetical protein
MRFVPGRPASRALQALVAFTEKLDLKSEDDDGRS